MDQNPSGGATGNTGIRDSTYDLVAVLYHALQGVENCQTYLQDASRDQQLQTFFQQAMQQQRQLADQAKTLLHDQLMNGEGIGGGSQSGSAFSQFGAGGSQDPQSSTGSQGLSDDNMQRRGSTNDREGGSAYTSGTSTGAQQNDPSMGQFGQSPMGGGQRHDEMSTGGGGTSSF
ncbi:MAG TPA: hypothetical protein VM913_01200 [Sphingomicrobium sp.]|jgi:hypothetical protein|nr:hypothetical protein [Sphingomicrobium sp.]